MKILEKLISRQEITVHVESKNDGKGLRITVLGSERLTLSDIAGALKQAIDFIQQNRPNFGEDPKKETVQ